MPSYSRLTSTSTDSFKPGLLVIFLQIAHEHVPDIFGDRDRVMRI
jgi:hypothetical protein